MGNIVEVKVPDIGDFDAVPIIELFVKVGDVIAIEDPICTLESDKASMEVPSSLAGKVTELLVKIGDKVSKGSLLLKLDSEDSPAKKSEENTKAESPKEAETIKSVSSLSSPQTEKIEAVPPEKVSPSINPVPSSSSTSSVETEATIHASPSVRSFARELGVDLGKVKASGPKGRILQEDVTSYVKSVIGGQSIPSSSSSSSGQGLDLLPWPKIDFSKYGTIETRALTRIQKISGQNLSRNWVMIPAVTFHEDADITDLESFRVAINKENEKTNRPKLTLLSFLLKVSVRALQEFPDMNSSLDGDNLVLKKYYNIGFAADTPNGLMVPVVKNVDQKSIYQIAQESSELAKLAREGKIKPTDMQGATFTISSLGGVGGTYFAPIINAPEVGILGVNKSAIKPTWNGESFVPRLILPLSLTADHRIIDGVMATKFNVLLSQLLADFRRVTL